eukprot:2697246-Pleurochrysis_carterae.AAC.2
MGAWAGRNGYVGAGAARRSEDLLAQKRGWRVRERYPLESGVGRQMSWVEKDGGWRRGEGLGWCRKEWGGEEGGVRLLDTGSRERERVPDSGVAWRERL